MHFLLHREHKALIVNHSLGDKLLCAATDELIESYAPQDEGILQGRRDKCFPTHCIQTLKATVGDNEYSLFTIT